MSILMQGETIVCVAPRIWDSLWRNTQQIMSRIAAHNRVLYFEPGHNPDRPHWSELQRNWSNLFKLQIQESHRNLMVIPTPPCLPYLRRHLPCSMLHITTPVLVHINAHMLRQHILRAMRRLGVSRPILWLYEPFHADLVGRLGEKLACYYNYDETADFAGNERIQALIRRYDARLSSRVNIVFASSLGQWRHRKAVNQHTYCIPNAVDFDLFHRALDPQTSIPPDIAALRRPLIGFIGWLGHQIDVDLLVQVAEQCPNCSLVLIGPDCLPDHAQHLRTLPNVVFLGTRQRTILPAYLKAFDVALIPYRIGGHTLTIYPLKLHEYLAAGRAVVATALPELQPYRHVVSVAETAEAFISHIRDALGGDTPQAIATRVAVARDNTWDHRLTEIYRILNQHLPAADEEHREMHVYLMDSP